MPFLFLEMAIMLNIAKWIYYFLLINTHRKIRLFEINAEIISGRDEITNNNSNPNYKDKKLKKLKK